MSDFALRLFVYSVLPVVLATINIALDKSCRSRLRNLEIFLLYLFGVGVGGGGIGGFFGHFFISGCASWCSIGRTPAYHSKGRISDSLPEYF